jgi:hypothetical protein
LTSHGESKAPRIATWGALATVWVDKAPRIAAWGALPAVWVDKALDRATWGALTAYSARKAPQATGVHAEARLDPGSLSMRPFAGAQARDDSAADDGAPSGRGGTRGASRGDEGGR